ncbi:MAG TPA: DUF58 domain-containing protein [Burkholderiales bacterium]|nr:DUF58 domain-containing protein [Burkholderiales bacterium]
MFKSLLRLRRKAATATSPPAEAPQPARVDAETLLRRMEWTVLKRLDGMLHGDYRSLMRGFGLDLADLREYQAHDDVRHIDWNVTARMQTPYVREFHEDREVFAWFLLDLSPSVDFGSGSLRKRELAAEVTATIGRMLTAHGNRVGALLYDGSSASLAEAVVPAAGGRLQVLRILDAVLRFQNRAAARDAAREKRQTDLGDMLARAENIIRRRSLVFLVSDFISRPGWEGRLALLARRNELVAVRLHDPLEAELPDLGLALVEDAETGEQIFVDTLDAGFRRRFAEAAARREQELRQVLARNGVDCLELSTHDRLDAALLRFAHLRKMRGKAGGHQAVSAHATAAAQATRAAQPS